MIILIIVVIVLIFVLTIYNNLIRTRNKVRNAESGIDVYLNQRFDLIPNLVECVKAYSKHEKEIIVNIMQMREQYMNNKKTNLKKAEELNNNMNRLIFVAENYPELKASEQFLKLQKSLSKMESQLQAARRIYNNEATKYNTKISIVPINIVAKVFRFKEEMLFEIEEFKKDNINIDLEE